MMQQSLVANATECNARVSAQANAPQARAGTATIINELLRGD